MPLRYIKVRWIHDHPNEPVWLVSELDDGRWETRKVEIFADGSKRYATVDDEVGGSFLGEVPVPTLDEIGSDQEFVPEEISREQFEEIWNARHIRASPAAL